MSITLKLVHLIDKLNIQSYFIEKNDRTYFMPIQFKFNTNKLEALTDKLIKVKGRAYKVNDLEKSILNDLDI
jgi:hypothetical protein